MQVMLVNGPAAGYVIDTAKVRRVIVVTAKDARLGIINLLYAFRGYGPCHPEYEYERIVTAKSNGVWDDLEPRVDGVPSFWRKQP